MQPEPTNKQTTPTALGNQPRVPRKSPSVKPSRALPATDPNKQTKYFCFTLNNYSEEECLMALPKGVTYLVYGREVGESGTPHLQGYLETSRAQRFSFVNKIFPRAAIYAKYENSTPQQAADYCKKEGKYVEMGVISPPSVKGKRNDLVRVSQQVQEGATLQQIYEADPATYMRNYRAIQHVRQITHQPAAHRDLVVRLFIGATRTGKSHYARVIEDCFAKPVGKGLWFDGYDRHKKVVIDEFRGQYPLADFLQITDPYKVQVETKGGHTWFEPELIIVTTNDHPCDMYVEHKEATRQAFYARFHEVWWWYAPRKYMILNDAQKKDFFELQQYPKIPIDTPTITVAPVLVNEPIKPSKKRVLDRTVSSRNLSVAPKYGWDSATGTLKKAKVAATLQEAFGKSPKPLEQIPELDSTVEDSSCDVENSGTEDSEGGYPGPLESGEGQSFEEYSNSEDHEVIDICSTSCDEDDRD